MSLINLHDLTFSSDITSKTRYQYIRNEELKKSEHIELELGDDFEDGDYGINLVAPSTIATQRFTGKAQANFISTSQIYNQAPNNPDIYQITLVGSLDTQFTGDLSGGETANIIEGGAGAEIIRGGAGDDKLHSDVEITDLFLVGAANGGGWRKTV